MNSNFILLNKTEKTIEFYHKLLINYPKSEIILRRNIEESLYNLIECLFAYNINKTDRIKQKYLKDFFIKLSMLDFYTKISFKKKVISKRHFVIICNYIIEARKITYSLVKGDVKVEN